MTPVNASVEGWQESPAPADMSDTQGSVYITGGKKTSGIKNHPHGLCSSLTPDRERASERERERERERETEMYEDTEREAEGERWIE